MIQGLELSTLELPGKPGRLEIKKESHPFRGTLIKLDIKVMRSFLVGEHNAILEKSA